VNSTQVKTILTPLIGIAVAWLASKFPLLDQATWNTLVSSIVFAIVSVVMGLFTKTTALADTVASQPGTTVVTTPAIANSTANPDVIASTPAIVTAVRAAS